jgi:hypothetical protein
MSRHSSDGEDWIFALVIGGIALTFALPILIVKAVEINPSFYQMSRIRDFIKKACVGLSVALALSAVLLVFPSIGHWTLFYLGKIRVQSGLIISWIISNLVLGSIAYMSIPIWRGLIRSKYQMKDQIY